MVFRNVESLYQQLLTNRDGGSIQWPKDVVLFRTCSARDFLALICLIFRCLPYTDIALILLILF